MSGGPVTEAFQAADDLFMGNPFVLSKFLELWDAAQLPANDY